MSVKHTWSRAGKRLPLLPFRFNIRPPHEFNVPGGNLSGLAVWLPEDNDDMVRELVIVINKFEYMG